MSDDPCFSDNYHILQQGEVQKISGPSVSGRPCVSVVPQMENYEADESLCLTSLVFPQATLGNRIQASIIDPLKKLQPSHYYYPTGSLHVTIKNIRSIASPPKFSEENITTADSVLRTIVPRFSRFSLHLRELVALRNSASIIAYSNRILGDLILSLDSELKMAGIPDDKVYISDSVFFGSMTICRFVGPPSTNFLTSLPQISAHIDEELFVEAIQLVVCNAVCNPGNRRIVGTYHLR
ncbi:MAG: hypothetical protein ACR2Q3_13490 [Woeseiaceae bacterium]